MTSEDLDELLRRKKRPPNPRGRPAREPAIAAARRRERSARAQAARRLALDALEVLHPADYDRLLAQAKIRVRAERGPLPGDDA